MSTVTLFSFISFQSFLVMRKYNFINQLAGKEQIPFDVFNMTRIQED